MKRVLATLGILFLPGLAVAGAALADSGHAWGMWLVAPFVIAVMSRLVWVCWTMTGRGSE